jgi:hypothetical protein
MCTLKFLRTCLKAQVIPLFITAWFVNVPIFDNNNNNNAALTRKLHSTKLELLRCCINEEAAKLETVVRMSGYEYLNVTRRGSENVVRPFLEKLNAALREEERQVYHRHVKKWFDLTRLPYPCDPYLFEHRFGFPVELVDGYWCGIERCPTVTSTHTVSYTNETDLALPEKVSEFLGKGPKYRLPPVLDSKFVDRAVANLDMLSYHLRWKKAIVADSDKKRLHIPFHRNTVYLPPHMSRENELELALLKKEILDATINEADRLKKTQHYRDDNYMMKQTKAFAKKNDLTIVPADKTNRLVITNKKDFDERILNFLGDETTYKPLSRSKQKSIENQANKIIRGILRDKQFTKSDTEKLLTSGSQPADFQAFIKDHKESSNIFPLRPIASVKNTAAEKVDWLVSKILGQLVDYVPTNVKNTEELVSELESIRMQGLNSNLTFISLDVVALYPSIPLDYGIKATLEIAEKHWAKIDNFDLSIEELKRCLVFICYNYEIKYKDNVYLQIKGCPMGAHFAPPFAILTMNKIEKEALQKLKNDLDIVPTIYKRYIDDIILGPFKRDELLNAILDIFNSINQNIQFTLEVPEHEKPLNFLDISIFVREKHLDFAWYSKACHSENSLKQDSWVPNSVKTNFVRNLSRNIAKRCSDVNLRQNSVAKIKNRLMKNGYKRSTVDRLLKPSQTRPTTQKKDTSSNLFLTMEFMSDRHTRSVRKILEKYDSSIRLINKPAQSIKTAFKERSKSKHKNCNVCEHLPKNYSCSDRFVVYKFTCRICNDFYIGETCRPFSCRYLEHQRSLGNNDDKSALSCHMRSVHKTQGARISGFDLQIVNKCSTPVATRLAEARAISAHRPALNRKFEIAAL